MSMGVIDKIKIDYSRIDHIAVAVHDLESAVNFYQNILGFSLSERRETNGKFSGMISAVMSSGDFTIVLIQGTEPQSQVSRFIDKYGAGVQHVALEVDNLGETVNALLANGINFSTTVISGPGLNQIFSERDENSGMMIELIERKEIDGFEDGNVQSLFEQLEEADAI